MSAMLVDVNWPEGKLNRQFVFYPSRWTYLDRSKSCPWRRRRTCPKEMIPLGKRVRVPTILHSIFYMLRPMLGLLAREFTWLNESPIWRPPIADACASLRRALCDGPLLPRKATDWQNISCLYWESFGLPILKRWLQWIGIIIPLSQDEHLTNTANKTVPSATFNWTQHVVRLSLKECWHLGGTEVPKGWDMMGYWSLHPWNRHPGVHTKIAWIYGCSSPKIVV